MHDYNAPVSASLSAFISSSLATSTPLALVTSGGTSVPLEKSTVRSIENFSTGSRGASSAEAFLSAGYNVIFMHRGGSKLPYLRSVDEGGCVSARILDNPHVATHDPHCASYVRAVEEARLYMLPFTSVDEYLSLLSSSVKAMRPLGPLGIYYAAAAVSDFHLPNAPEHKIQSGTTDGGGPAPVGSGSGAGEAGTSVDVGGRLHITLEPVPKCLGRLKAWCPGLFVCGFKLETDPSILAAKASGSLRRYGLDCVVANLLKSRKEVCWIYDPEGGVEEVRSSDMEGAIVSKVAALHMEHVEKTHDPAHAGVSKVELRARRDRRVWDGLGGWKKAAFWAWERLGPLVGLGLAWWLQSRKRLK